MLRIRQNRIFHGIAYGSLGIVPVFMLLLLEYMNAAKRSDTASYMIRWMSSRWSLILFDLLLLAGIFLLLWLLVKRGSATFGIMGGLALLAGGVNYLKQTLNGDALFPKDVLMLQNTGELTSFVNCSLPWPFYVFLALYLLWLAALILWEPRCPLSWKIRYPAAAVLLMGVSIFFSNAKRVEKTINHVGLYFEDAALQNSNYTANGFVGAFTVNLLSMSVQVPEGYSQPAVEAILADYMDTLPQEGAERYDVIVVLSESFFDIRDLDGVSFSENPLSYFDKIISHSNCYSGKIYTTAVGGGTVRSEFDVLTGLTTDGLPSGASPYYYADSGVETYVSNYQAQGYHTLALHLYDKTFYTRTAAYPGVGFDAYYGIEDLSDQVDITYKRGLATDSSTLACMEYLLDQSEGPTFLSTITIQNHQPYNKLEESDLPIQVESDLLRADGLTAVETYVQGLYDADQFLGNLVDYIDHRERPTVLLFYGDHLPTLGLTNNSYIATGYYEKNGDDPENMMKQMYSTPFLIYSNREVSSAMFQSHQDLQVSSYYMLTAVAQMTGGRMTPYMNYLAESYWKVPFYNVRLQQESTPPMLKLKQEMLMITYDRLVGKRYSNTE